MSAIVTVLREGEDTVYRKCKLVKNGLLEHSMIETQLKKVFKLKVVRNYEKLQDYPQ